MKNKVYFFDKKIECTIDLIFIIFFIILGKVCWENAEFLIQKLEVVLEYELSDLEIGILLIVIEIIILGVLTLIDKLLKKKISSSSFIKHKLYSKFRPIFLKLKHNFSRMLGNKSLNAFYHTNYKPTPEQKQVSKYITSILHQENIGEENKVLWIQGNSFSGKTTTISHILINLISIKDNYKIFNTFNNRIEYIDLFKDDYEKFIDKYEKQKYSKSILIVDNTYVLSEKLLQQLIDKIYKAPLAKLTIVCLRDFKEISNDIYFTNKLREKMEDIGAYFYIPQVWNNNLSKNLFDKKYKIKTFEQMNLSSQFHYMSMYEKNKESNNKIFEDIYNYLNKNINTENINHKVIFIISTFCMFTGSFTKKELFKIFTELKSKIMLDIILSELHSCGFIDRSPYGFGEMFIFNADVAKHYFKIGYKSNSFKNIAHNILVQQYEYYSNSSNHFAFLYGCLLKDKSQKLTEIFDLIAINTNFRMLLNEILFLESVERDIETIYKREIGILCDRTGEFLKSRKEFRKLLDFCEEKNNIDLALETFYRLVQIDHTEYNNHNELRNYHSDSVYLQFQKKYWKLHIDMHKGRFDFTSFLKLLDETKVLAEKNCYDHLHLSRRIYFDAYRLYYLEGRNNTDSLLKIGDKGREIETYLSDNLTEYNLYYTKFTTLFLLCFDLIYNLAVYEDTVDEDIFNKFIKTIGIEYSSMSDKDKLLDKTIKLCEDLEIGFDNIGDKTFNFIKYYKTSLLIVKNDPSVKTLIKQYKEFGSYEIEYQLYADFIELKYRISQLLELEKIFSYSDDEYDVLRKNVDEQLKVVNGYFTGSYSNDYAVMRYKVYQLLLSIIDQKGVSEELFKNALSLAKKNNYYREIKLLEKIKEREIKGKLSFAWVRIVLLYYPIVPQ